MFEGIHERGASIKDALRFEHQAGLSLFTVGWSNTMSDITKEQAEDEILDYEISDEALENAAAGGQSGAYTMGFCTGLAACPS